MLITELVQKYMLILKIEKSGSLDASKIQPGMTLLVLKNDGERLYVTPQVAPKAN
jgi:hypothetical protein